MTWGVNPDKGSAPKKDGAFSSQPSKVIPVVADYTYPTTEVFHAAITLIVAGILTMGVGIGHVLVTPDLEVEDALLFHTGYPIWTGVIFIIAGAIALDSSRRRTRARLIATTIFTSFSILVALCVGVILLRSLFLPEWFEDSYPDRRGKRPSGGSDSDEDDDKDDERKPQKKTWWFRFIMWLRIRQRANTTLIEFKMTHRLHRHKRMSMIKQQLYDDPAYFATTVCLLVFLVAIISASLNLLIHAITALKKGRKCDLDVYNGNTEEKVTKPGMGGSTFIRYFRVNVVMVAFGVLSCLLGIGQTAAALVDKPFYSDLHFSPWLTGYPIWLSVWFILTGVYGLRSCKDERYLTQCMIIQPLIAMVVSGCMIGYTIWSAFAKYDRGGSGDMYKCSLYMGFATSLVIADVVVFICAILLVVFVVKLCKRGSHAQTTPIMTEVANIKIEPYKQDAYNGNID